MQKNCQAFAQNKTDTHEQQFLNLQCQNTQYQQYISYLTHNHAQIEQLSQQYQTLVQQYQALATPTAANEPPHPVHQKLKKARTQCEAKSPLLSVLTCKIAVTRQAISILAQRMPSHTPTETPVKPPTAAPAPKTELDNLF